MATLQIIYSGGTINLLDSAQQLAQRDGWAPNVSYLRDSEFGGLGGYADVDESITLALTAGTAAVRYQQARKLALAMDEATRWARGQTGQYGTVLPAVRLRYAPTGGSAGTVDAVILGRPKGGENPFGLGAAFTGPSNVYPDNALRFSRRPLWISTTETSGTASADRTTQPLGAALSPATALSLVRYSVQMVIPSGGTANTGFYVMQHTNAANLAGNTSFGTTSPWSSAAESSSTGAHSGTSILRYTPSGTAEVASTSDYLLGSTRRANHIFMMARNNSPANTFYVRMARYRAGYDVDADFTGRVPVTTNSNQPQVVYLGMLPGFHPVITPVSNSCYLRLLVSVDSTAGTTNTLDIDRIVISQSESEHDSILAVPGGVPFAGTITLSVDHRALSDRLPSVTFGHATLGTATASYRGNAYITQGTSSSFILQIVGPQGANWRTSGTATLTAYKRAAYLLPE